MKMSTLEFSSGIILLSFLLVLTARAQPELIVPGAAPYDMDLRGERLYWTEVADESCVLPYTIKLVRTSGGIVDTLISGCTTKATEMRYDGSFLVFFDIGTSNVSRLARDDTHPAQLAPTTGIGFEALGNLTTDFNFVYWGDDTGIHRVPKYFASVHPRIIVPSTSHNASYWLAVDDAYVYWAEGSRGSRSLRRAPTAGGPVEILLDSLDDPQYLAVDSMYLYWADPGARVRRIPKAGGAYLAYNGANTSFFATGLVVDSQYVYWSQNGPAGVDSVIIRRSHKDMVDTSDLITGRNAGLLRQDSYFLYWRDIDGIKRVAKDAPSVTADFSVPKMEITQAIQNLNNDVPLVVGRPTLVRVYPGAHITGAVSLPMTAVLRGTRGGSALPGSPLRPIQTTIQVASDAGIDRLNPSNSFNFLLPRSWTSGGATVTLTGEINPYRAIPEANYANNTLTISNLTFTPKTGVCLGMITISTPDFRVSRFSVTNPGFRPIIQRFASLHPSPRIYTFQFSGTEGPRNIPEDHDWIIASLIANDYMSAEGTSHCSDGDEWHVVGMVSPDAPTGSNLGFANFVVPVCYVKMESDPSASGNIPFYTPRGGFTMAQEVAHNYNGWPYFPTDLHRWGHVMCGVTDLVNPDYPYGTNYIGPIGTNNYYGFDLTSFSAIAPNGAADFMAYCEPKWISDYNWRGLFDNLPTVSPLAAPSASGGNPVGPGPTSVDTLFLTGGIRSDGSFKPLLPGYRLPPELVDARTALHFKQYQNAFTFPAASCLLEELDAPGNVLLSQVFEPFDIETHDADPGKMFFLTLPFDAATAKVRISHNGTAIANIPVSPNVPTVSIIKPAGGETFSAPFPIKWTGADADGDSLIYTVQYSYNGGSNWQVLALSNMVGSMLQDVADLPGGTNCLVRVLASDGMNIGYATSLPFNVQTHAPIAFIDAPADLQSFAAGDQIILKGGGYDIEDGTLPESSLSWNVSTLGFAGSGDTVTLPGLPPGVYYVTLSVADSEKQTGSTTIRILVSLTGEAPRLSFVLDSKDLVLSWPVLAEDFRLETADSLVAPANWRAITNEPILLGDQNTITMNVANSSQFFRLRDIRVQ